MTDLIVNVFDSRAVNSSLEQEGFDLTRNVSNAIGHISDSGRNAV